MSNAHSKLLCCFNKKEKLPWCAVN